MVVREALESWGLLCPVPKEARVADVCDDELQTGFGSGDCSAC